MLSISTSWDCKPDTNWQEWLTRIKSFGFDAIELSYTITRSQLQEIEGLLDKLNVKVNSIHSFCPLPDDGPSSRHLSNYYRLSAVDEQERQKAVEWTNICIDTAKRVGASVVIIHAGTLELENDPSMELFKLYKGGCAHLENFKKARERVLQVREERKKPFMEALEISLKDVMAHAQENNVKIGLETRYYPIEIPNFDEIAHFLNLFGQQGMYYWHDVGHAEVNERLGIKPHLDFLNAYKDPMVGIHLHGMKVLRDHLAPYDGDMDLNKIMPFLEDHVLKVIEARYATPEQIASAAAQLTNNI